MNKYDGELLMANAVLQALVPDRDLLCLLARGCGDGDVFDLSEPFTPSKQKALVDSWRGLQSEGWKWPNSYIALASYKNPKIKTLAKVLRFLGQESSAIWTDMNANAGGPAEQSEQTWRILRRAPCLGPFLAHQVAINIGYGRPDLFDEDSFAIAGPGHQTFFETLVSRCPAGPSNRGGSFDRCKETLAF